MAHFPELSPSTYAGIGAPGFTYLSVGWLGDRIEQSGGTDPRIVARLEVLCHEHVDPGDRFLGLHTCEICNRYQQCGSFTIESGRIRYLIPMMVFHYIAEHRYRLPEVVEWAILAAPMPQIDFVISSGIDSALRKLGYEPLRVVEGVIELESLAGVSQAERADLRFILGPDLPFRIIDQDEGLHQFP